MMPDKNNLPTLDTLEQKNAEFYKQSNENTDYRSN
jgi:hypothetical protein